MTEPKPEQTPPEDDVGPTPEEKLAAFFTRMLARRAEEEKAADHKVIDFKPRGGNR